MRRIKDILEGGKERGGRIEDILKGGKER